MVEPYTSRLAAACSLGRVYIVGGGPGRSGLLTVRARQVLAQADVILYDRLLSPRVLSFASSESQFVDVGKEAGRHTMNQREINERLVAEAMQGKVVVRLKGGDPYVLGRGAEEAETCQIAGVPFEVIPGISSSVAVPLFAGIPVTHRRAATGFSVVTGHRSEDMMDAVAVPQYGDRDQTLIVLMGLQHIERIVAQLREAGRDQHTPVACIRWGTRSTQETVVGTLANIQEKVAFLQIKPPAILVVGEVVRYRSTLQWFERQPLMGQRILVAGDTREQARAVGDDLEALGAEVVDVSVQQARSAELSIIEALFSAPAPVDGSLQFHRISAVHGFFNAFAQLGLDCRRLAAYRIGAVHTEIARILLHYGIVPDFVEGIDGRPTATPIARMDGEDISIWSAGAKVRALSFMNRADSREQLDAIWKLCEVPFDLCYALSDEALEFVQGADSRLPKNSFPNTIVFRYEDSHDLRARRGVFYPVARSNDDLRAFIVDRTPREMQVKSG